MLEVKELASVICSEFEKPGWLKRKLIWPLKSKLLRSLPFKVGTGNPLFGSPAHVQVLLVGLGVAAYWADVGFDADGMLRWLTMTGCYR